MMTDVNNFQYVREHVREVPDFPKKGILFLDVTTIVKDAKAFNMCIDFLYEKFKDENIDYVAGIESRGFIFGAPLACKLNAGFVTVRKPNKLPADTIKETYDLEYGTDTIEMHADAVKAGDRVLVIDDLLATGGTAAAACNLVKKAGADVVASAFIIELDPLKGREKIEASGVNVVSMLNYDLD
ncbi:TPA: adenine phosphoribosyltransferase [Candidatus Gastranaerophilales bacterium HUM_15]|jgi:adenine phosphoribosyltransferase|nr:adenine phosphoribosyltransferase [Acinetobacter sp. CAG:196]DAA86070.1 MAG TPA: adenine phosphoribosyltransferase [Candidatus Gastranaerophilales bacterium HUM_4]DAA89224.1 MAG TPA: adenine phosphoribosyltransferase [Candidatus Gastranaerophilales bacterium HUM_5]DAB03305.1 MAG TPA: adenine phosphoribosyltransferase [Candidatus Gastranaerophilales bacterium HUM_10]DAB07406.1 MAG TPA: adenine phosphoribosyltransferase [Candidatus Gastranaerophilales bacterium HUM_15]